MTLLRWLGNRIRRAINSWVEGLILTGAIALALLVWRAARPHLSADLSVPMWLVAGVAGAVLAILLIQGLRLRQRSGEIELQVVTTAYAEHLLEILYSFQGVLTGEIPGVTTREWVEDGILEPARDLIRTRQVEDVRLSILTTDGEDFVMPFAAGHTLESKRSFRLAIDESFSKWAYRNNLIVWSGDLGTDERFAPHPWAAPEREYNSIICVPIRRGDRVVAVFNTVFTESDAFDEADLLYVRLIGAVIELVWSLAEDSEALEA